RLRLKRFHDHRDPLPAADAGAAQAVVLPDAPEGVEEVDGDARPARAERVADRHGAPLGVGARPVQAELLLDREVLRRERLVHLHPIHLGQAHPGALQRLPCGRRRADAHDLGLDARYAPGDQPADRLETALLRERRRRYYTGARAVRDARGVPRRHHTLLAEDRGKFGEALGGGIGTHVLVGGPRLRLLRLPIGDRHRTDLVGEPAPLPRGRRRLLAPQRVAVHVGALDAVLRREILRRDPHWAPAIAVGEPLPEEVF